jgi:hypothetical protein
LEWAIIHLVREIFFCEAAKAPPDYRERLAGGANGVEEDFNPQRHATVS